MKCEINSDWSNMHNRRNAIFTIPANSIIDSKSQPLVPDAPQTVISPPICQTTETHLGNPIDDRSVPLFAVLRRQLSQHGFDAILDDDVARCVLDLRLTQRAIAAAETRLQRPLVEARLTERVAAICDARFDEELAADLAAHVFLQH